MADNRSPAPEIGAVVDEIKQLMSKRPRPRPKTLAKESNANQGERHLAVSVMLQAIKDAKEDPSHHKLKGKQTESQIHKNDALHWLMDDKEWGFTFWSSVLGLNPYAVRERIMKQLNGDIESPKLPHRATAAFR